MIRDKERIRANRTYNQSGCRHLATPCTHRDPIAVANAQARRRPFVHLNTGIGSLLFEERRASCLVARQIMVDDASSGKYQWILLIRLLSRRDVKDGLQTRAF
jgi:hypothetical protein